jgi:hypothetical protein
MRQVRSPNPRVGESSDSAGAADSAGRETAESASAVGSTEAAACAEAEELPNEPWKLTPPQRPKRPHPRPKPSKPPTVRQVYALAAALCAFTDQDFPRTRDEASDLIERLRIDIGHPEPSLPEPPPPSRRARRFARGARPD